MLLLFDLFYVADRLYIAISMMVLIISMVVFYKRRFRQGSSPEEAAGEKGPKNNS